jgi:hypothetical protein
LNTRANESLDPFISNLDQVSMVVHRIGKTILLDEFDVHKHLMRPHHHGSSSAAIERWEAWWRRFYAACTANQQAGARLPPRKNRTREALENKNLVSKFLYRSIDTEDAAAGQQQAGMIAAEPPNVMASDGFGGDGASRGAAAAAGTDADTLFSRTLLWTFEDIRMLIG